MNRFVLMVGLLGAALAAAETKAKQQKDPVSQPESKLNAGAAEAVSLARGWQNGDPLPSPGENGAVRYRYGAAMPPVVCAPERLTTVMLEPGEKIAGDPIIGDSTRWYFAISLSGEGPGAQAAIVLKPIKADLSTDLVVSTNRRIYNLLLVSRASEHLSRVEFSYPTDSGRAFAGYQAALTAAHADKPVEDSRAKTKTDPVETFPFSVVATKGDHPPFTPRAVGEKGGQTILHMAPEATNWETAVLETAGPNGCEPVNYRTVGNDWIVDRLFTKAELVSGSGKHAQRVLIVRDGSLDKSECGPRPAHAETVATDKTGGK